jgi:hypothetical protein
VLPPDFALHSALGELEPQPSQHAFYSVRNTSQIFRQAVSICTILTYPLISLDSVFDGYSSSSEDLLPLLDAWLDILQVHRRLRTDKVAAPQIAIMSILVNLIHRQELVTGSNAILREKACVLLVLCCSELAVRPEPLLGENAEAVEGRNVFCRALILLAYSVKFCDATKRFVASKLIHELMSLIDGKPQLNQDESTSGRPGIASIGPGTDLSVRSTYPVFLNSTDMCRTACPLFKRQLIPPR